MKALNFDQRRVQLSDCFRKLIAMREVILRNMANRFCQLAQNVSEQPKVDVHVNRFVDVIGARPF